MTDTITPPRSRYRPRKGESADEQAQIQFRLHTGLRKRLWEEAARRGVSVNYLIERSLGDSLTKWEKQKLA
jgi:predicted HicB family RNase H-like nuclease